MNSVPFENRLQDKHVALRYGLHHDRTKNLEHGGAGKSDQVIFNFESTCDSVFPADKAAVVET